MKITTKLKAFALGLILASPGVMANPTTQGSVGFVSTGSVHIIIDVQDSMQITQLADIDLLVADLVLGNSGSSPACVSRNAAGNYNVTGSGDGLGGPYTLVNGASTITYSVVWNHGGAFALPAGAAVGPFVADGNNDDCVTLGAPNASVDVNVTPADMIGATVVGIHTGDLYLTVAPI